MEECSSSLVIVVAVLGTAGTIVYTAYAGGQKELREVVKEQTEVTQKTETKLTEIEVNQQYMKEKQRDFKNQIDGMEKNQHKILEELIKIRNNQVNGY
jgi:peptidoglycan hydrolase CwlO-like protein